MADTKLFHCVSCGKEIMLTKFASQKTCKCDECKEAKKPIDPAIVAKYVVKKEEAKKSESATKMMPCINCGTMVEVSKFMSAQKVLCSKCKGTVDSAPRIRVDKSKIAEMDMPPIYEYNVNEAVIANERLRRLECPSCGHKYMKPTMIIDWSQFGMIIDYQCQSCMTTISLSEQSRRPIKIHHPSKRFDYTGMQIKDLGLGLKDSSRMANALCTLIDKCEKEGIDIDETMKDYIGELPPYRFNEEKPVESGFKIPEEDVWISLVDEASKKLKDVDASLSNKLSSLLKGDKGN